MRNILFSSFIVIGLTTASIAQTKEWHRDSTTILNLDIKISLSQLYFLWKVDKCGCYGFRFELERHLRVLYGSSTSKIIELLGEPDFIEKKNNHTEFSNYSCKRWCEKRKGEIKDEDIEATTYLNFKDNKLINVSDAVK